LGSSFYRNARDIRGYFMGTHDQAQFFQALFSDLGIAPVVESSDDLLWSERFISNNGTTEMLILGNQNPDQPLHEAAARWKLDFAPRRVFDPVTGHDLAVKISGNTVTLDHLNLDPLEMRYYAVERPDRDGAGMVQHWLFRQSQLWHAVPPGRAAPPPDPSWPAIPRGNLLVKQFDSEPAARAALGAEGPTDATWQSLPLGDWASYGLRTGTNVWAVYRKTFTLDPAWLRDLRGVEFNWNPWQLGACPQELFINGLLVWKNTEPANDDQLLGVLKPGENLFTAIVRGRQGDGDGGLFNPWALRRIPGANGEVQDLSKQWTLYSSDVATHLADFPTTASLCIARKSVVIPASYRDRSVWLEVKTTNPQDCTYVATNGNLRYIGGGGAYWRGPFLMNITPDVKFGEANDLVIGAGNDVIGGLTTRKPTYEYAHLIFVPRE
jgi:hypothetical protein